MYDNIRKKRESGWRSVYNLFLLLYGITTFVAFPATIIILIVNLIRKKSRIKAAVALLVSLILSFFSCSGALFTVPEDMQVEFTTEPVTEETTKKQEVTTAEPTTESKDIMTEQFVSLGFTQDEAEKMKEIFATVGITEISNIRAVGNNGIDNLQAFICDIFDYSKDKGGVSVHFTVDKRQLCFISLDGIPTTNVDYAYINIFGNVKFKTSNGKRSVTLYDVWDENGEIIPDAVGYQAVFDYENKKITAY